MKKEFSFRMAKDDLLFDVDNIAGEMADTEVEVIQFLRPDAKRRRMIAPVGKDLAEKAKNLILSAEQLRTGKIAIYARKIGESEENEKMDLANNGPGINSPANVLKKLIRKVSGGKQDAGKE